MKRQTTYTTLVVLLTTILLTGCASILPREHTVTQSPWGTFEDVKTSYEEVVTEKTNIKELEELGFTPEGNPNVEIYNYWTLANIYEMSQLATNGEAPDWMNICSHNKEYCKGFRLTIQSVHSDRIGNVFADLLGFKKKIKKFGWKFEATFILIGDRVIYKSWDGQPKIEEYHDKTVPLGPFQNVSDWLSF